MLSRFLRNIFCEKFHVHFKIKRSFLETVSRGLIAGGPENLCSLTLPGKVVTLQPSRERAHAIVRSLNTLHNE